MKNEVLSTNLHPLILNSYRFQSPYVPSIFSYYADVCLPSSSNYVKCNGTDLTAYQAYKKLIGESIERYSSFTFNLSELCYGSSTDLSSISLNPVALNKFQFFSHDQYNQVDFPFLRPSTNTKLFWKKSRQYQIRNGHLKYSSCYIPAELIYLDFSEYKLHIPLSTGTACHESFESAAINGLLEVVERDAFMLTWKRKLQVQEIDSFTVPDLRVVNLTRELNQHEFEIHIFDITQDNRIPVALALAIGHNGLPKLSVATAAAFSLCNAIYKSVLELICVINWGISRIPILRSGGGFQEALASHGETYLKEFSRQQISFLFVNPIKEFSVVEAIHPPQNASLYSLIETLQNHNCSIYITDLTPKSIRDLGYFVCKSTVPELLPLDINHEYQYNGLKRLHLPPHAFPYKGTAKINNQIHPFV